MSSEEKTWRASHAQDLRDLADMIEANADIDLCLVSYRLSFVDGVQAEPAQHISGMFAEEGTYFEELRALALSLVEWIDDELEAAQAAKRAPESQRR